MKNLSEYDDQLAIYTKKLLERDERLHNYLDKKVEHYIDTNKKKRLGTERRLFFKVVERVKIDTAISISINHFTKVMERFARWFSYLFHNPTLINRTFRRLNKIKRLMRFKIWI